ncbi:MAG TPA: hypothetical protein VFA95_00350 [Gammaproteobacteria bacterium]|nr:hypothetical protein [Gammaproteobacteria bacterium]
MSYRALSLLSVALVSLGLLVGGPQIAGAAALGTSATQARSDSPAATTGSDATRLILAAEDNAAQQEEHKTYGCDTPNQLPPARAGQTQTTNENGPATPQTSYGCDTPTPGEKGSSCSGTTQPTRTDITPERAHQTSGCDTPSPQ